MGSTIKVMRKLRKFGRSIGLTFPFDLAQQMKLEPDEDITIKMDFENKVILLLLEGEQSYPDVFIRYENGQYQLWNRLIMQEDVNKLLAYKEKIKLKSQVEELNGQKYFVIWL